MYWMDYRIGVGEMAPDFRIESTSGKSVRLYDYKNKKAVVLFFFNYEDGRCLDRLKALAADYGMFKDAGAEVFPITIIRLDEGKALADRLGLPFGILCDDDHSVSKAYKASRCSEPAHVCFQVLEKVQTPTMFVIDTSGIFRFIQAVDASGRPDNAALLEACRKSFE